MNNPQDISALIARVIDPDGWATFDRQMGELRRLGRDPEQERGPWMYVQRSIAKAEEILALLKAIHSQTEGGDDAAK